MKICKKCSISKEEKDYPLTGKGYTSYNCKSCTALYKKQRKESLKKKCFNCDNLCHHDSILCRSCTSKKTIFKQINTLEDKACKRCKIYFIDKTATKQQKYCSKSCQDKDWLDNNSDHTERYKETRVAWFIKNEEYRKQYHKQRNKQFPYIANAKTAKRRAAKLNATLSGFDEQIQEIYRTCPEGYHVDHIIPLQGETVSGLHVPWNLRHLDAKENLKKGNKLIEDTNPIGQI